MIRLEKTDKTCQTAHGLPRALNSMSYTVMKLPREPVSGLHPRLPINREHGITEPTVRFAFVVNFLSRCVIAHISILVKAGH
jgi:hypothetical protein